MTATNPAAATSPTKVPGLYTANGDEAQVLSPNRETLSLPARTILLDAAQKAASHFPLQGAISVASPEVERELSLSGARLIQRTSRRKTEGMSPVYWAKGPLDFLLTSLAFQNRSRDKRAAFSQQAVRVFSVATIKRLDEVYEIVNLISQEVFKPSPLGRVRLLSDGQLRAVYHNQAARAFNSLPSELNTHRSNSEVVTAMRAFRQQITPLTSVGAALGNRNNIPMNSTGGWQHPRDDIDTSLLKTLRNQLGDQRADLQAATALMLMAYRDSARSNNRSMAADAHSFFNFDYGAQISDIALAVSAFRSLFPGQNWEDPGVSLALNFARHCSGHIAFNHLDIFCKGPISTNLNEDVTYEKLVSNDLKPTAEWEDGTKLFIFDGVEFDPEKARAVVQEPSLLLKENNAERRRALLRLVGNDRLLKSVEATLVSEDEFGKLYQLPNKTQFVIVTNATPEPDGHFKEYVLGARGNNHTTARSAVASTWGLKAEQYWPVRET